MVPVSRASIAAFRARRSLQQQVAVVDQSFDLGVAVGEHLGGRPGVGQQPGQLLVAGGDRPREPAQAVERAAHRTGRAVEGLGEDPEALRELVGVEVLDRRRQLRERLDDVEGRAGAVPRDRRVGVERRVAGRLEVDVLLPEHRLDLDRGRGAVPTQASGALNEMTTSLPSSSRSVTVPIRMPAMRTSSSGWTPADSLKRAEYVGPCPMRGRSLMFRDAAISSSRIARLGRADRQGVPLAERLHPLHRPAVSGRGRRESPGCRGPAPSGSGSSGPRTGKTC